MPSDALLEIAVLRFEPGLWTLNALNCVKNDLNTEIELLFFLLLLFVNMLKNGTYHLIFFSLSIKKYTFSITKFHKFA